VFHVNSPNRPWRFFLICERVGTSYHEDAQPGLAGNQSVTLVSLKPTIATDLGHYFPHLFVLRGHIDAQADGT
jgi:hypothetical protein